MMMFLNKKKYGRKLLGIDGNVCLMRVYFILCGGMS